MLSSTPIPHGRTNKGRKPAHPYVPPCLRASVPSPSFFPISR